MNDMTNNRSPGGQFISAQSQRITQDVVPESPLRIYRPVPMRIIPDDWGILFPVSETDVLILNLGLHRRASNQGTIDFAEIAGETTPTSRQLRYLIPSLEFAHPFSSDRPYIIQAGRSLWWRNTVVGTTIGWSLGEEIRGRLN